MSNVELVDLGTVTVSEIAHLRSARSVLTYLLTTTYCAPPSVVHTTAGR